MINKLINWSIQQLITRVSCPVHYKFESLNKNSAPNYSKGSEISRAYFNNKLDGVQAKCKEIISQLLQSPKNVTRHQQLLSQYLDIHGSVNKPKSPRDLLILLTAINMNNQVNLSNYYKQIFEHMIRNKVDEQVMDPVMLKCFLQTVRTILNLPLEKAKYQHIVYTYLKVVKAHFQAVNMNEYYHIITILTAQKKNRLYFVKFALKLQQFFIQAYYKPYLEGRTTEKIEAYMKHTSNQISMLRLMSYYNSNPQNGQIIYNFIDRFYLKDKMIKGLLNYDAINKIYRYYPYNTKDANGILHKTKVLNQIIAYLQQKNIVQFSSNKQNVTIFCRTIVHHLFYQQWMNLNFSQIQDTIFLERDELKEPPTLPDYFWQLYSHNSEELNSITILKDVIKSVYPTKFINNKPKQTKQAGQPLSQTEMRIRMQMVLMNLKIAYKKEMYVEGRHLDFLLEDKIALQLDGLIHFDPSTFQIDQKTTYRNIHLLHAGYKIIVINIHQYNLNREVPQLTKLLEHKLAIMKQYNCIAVL